MQHPGGLSCTKPAAVGLGQLASIPEARVSGRGVLPLRPQYAAYRNGQGCVRCADQCDPRCPHPGPPRPHIYPTTRSEEHTSELQSLMRISYAVFCLKKKKNQKIKKQHTKKILANPLTYHINKITLEITSMMNQQINKMKNKQRQA